MRSSAVGVFATLSDVTTLLLLVYVGGLREDLANIPSLIPGLLVMFFGNKYFAFEDRSRQVLRQGGRFLFVEAWAFALNAMLFHLLVREAAVPFLAARLMGTAVVYLAFSFPLWTFIFRKTSGQQSAVSSQPGGTCSPVSELIAES
jgi:putative flippase GtrA